MTESSMSSSLTPAAAATAVQQPAVHPDVQSSAEWFWWIAGLSLLTAAMSHSGQVIGAGGLGILLIADIMFADQQSIAFIIHAIVLGFFFLMGFYGIRGKAWAFYLGLVVYMLDTLICVWFQDWLAAGFHLLWTYIIVRGAMSLRQAATLIEPMTSSSPAPATIVAVGPTVNRVAESGAKWFFWICLLSLVFVRSDSAYVGHVIGIGMVQMSDVIVPGSHVIAGLFKAAVYGFFCLMALFAIRGHLWAFMLGLVVYLLDALIGVWFQDWWSVSFHAVVACLILRGAIALRRAPQAAA